MKKTDVLATLEDRKIVAVVRVDTADQIDPTVDALLAGGVNSIELTMTIPNVLDHLPALIKRVGDQMVLGIGSVLNGETAQRVIDAGANFVVSPVMKADIIEAAQKNNIAVAVGAFSPTEIQTAWELGSDVVKVFPADQFGPGYIKAVKAPMPHLRLMPTGGVTVQNVGEWLSAGTFSLGLGSALVDIKAVRSGDYARITSNARALVDAHNAWKSH
ncbi:MAG: bifunctional 4-hydroxy-2-oxoglutarate aldolase/2-dehydro-3-deoxy-phosphogluconate aldolase [Bacteroidetes bacterium]|nr:bifunctional 4-hydroxy-2-oxoglutarate aldolase/2-dehydro-3-deoxy-phosphogluconate aldolase [Bacteroidota bacterium]